MNTLNTDDAIIRNTIDASLAIIASNSPLRVKHAKSTFNVSPDDHRFLDTICKLTGKTKQEFFTYAVRMMRKDKTYMELFPLDQVKELSAKIKDI